MAEDRALLLSVKPQYANLILDGRKTVELRRTLPALLAGASVVLYGSSPTRAILGTARLAAVECETPAQLWKSVGHLTGVTFQQFAAYFANTSVAYGLRLTAPRACEPLPLQELRQHGLEPAQSWRYLTQEQFQHLDLRPSDARAESTRARVTWLSRSAPAARPENRGLAGSPPHTLTASWHVWSPGCAGRCRGVIRSSA